MITMRQWWIAVDSVDRSRLASVVVVEEHTAAVIVAVVVVASYRCCWNRQHC